LARQRQVLVVTHLPQVAAFADRHVVVDKPTGSRGNGVTASDVRLVSGADRVGELARMLAGSDSATAREHAAELLADAAAELSGGPAAELSDSPAAELPGATATELSGGAAPARRRRRAAG
jgi:DNA repair protein RecN (Recombination protein N)